MTKLIRFLVRLVIQSPQETQAEFRRLRELDRKITGRTKIYRQIYEPKHLPQRLAADWFCLAASVLEKGSANGTHHMTQLR